MVCGIQALVLVKVAFQPVEYTFRKRYSKPVNATMEDLDSAVARGDNCNARKQISSGLQI